MLRRVSYRPADVSDLRSTTELGASLISRACSTTATGYGEPFPPVANDLRPPSNCFTSGRQYVPQRCGMIFISRQDIAAKLRRRAGARVDERRSPGLARHRKRCAFGRTIQIARHSAASAPTRPSIEADPRGLSFSTRKRRCTLRRIAPHRHFNQPGFFRLHRFRHRTCATSLLPGSIRQ
mgnify:CR=1 FL=1